MGKEQGDLSHVIHRHWRGTSEITTSSLGLQDSRADKKHLWSDKLHILLCKNLILIHYSDNFYIIQYWKLLFLLLLTFESPSIFKTFTCFYPSLATINRTVDSSLGFDWLSRWWEILDRNRAFSASPPGNALFFRRKLPAQRPKRWFSLKWERKFLTKLEISQKKGLFVCMDLLCCGSLSQPPRASRKEYKLGLG